MYTNRYVKQLTKLGCTEIEHIKGKSSAWVTLPMWIEEWAGTRGYFDLQELAEDLQIQHEKLAAQQPKGENQVYFHNGQWVQDSTAYLAYRVVANISPVTDSANQRLYQEYPNLGECLVGVWDIATESVYAARGTGSGILVNWAIAQVLVRIGDGYPIWRTIETIALNEKGSRVVHSLSDKSGIPFDLDTPEDDFAPLPGDGNFDNDPDGSSTAQEPEGEPMGIDEQMQVWRDNTPVWDRLPGDGQSAIYVLGHSRETLQSIGQDGLQPNGAIVVFNARRGTVRAYCATDSRIARVHRLGFSNYGVISWAGNGNLSPSFGYCNGDPEGMLLPTYDAILYCTDCAVVWNRAIVGFVPDCSLRLVRSAIEDQWINEVGDRLRQNRFTTQLRGAFLMSFPEVSESPEEFIQIPWEPECSSTTRPSPMGCGESNRIRENLMLQRGYTRDAVESARIEWRNGDRGFGWQIEIANGDRLYWDGSSFGMPHPRADLSTSQVNELLTQLDTFGEMIDKELTFGDLDRAEWASLYVIQIGKILG